MSGNLVVSLNFHHFPGENCGWGTLILTLALLRGSSRGGYEERGEGEERFPQRYVEPLDIGPPDRPVDKREVGLGCL